MKYLIIKITVFLFKNLLGKYNEYKNIHFGEECYIFGEGVSLKWFDFNLFSNKITIACNKLAFHNDFDKLNVKYSVLIEPFWFYPSWWTKYVSKSESMPKIASKFLKLINKKKDTKFFLHLSNYLIFQNKKNVNFLINNNIYNFQEKDNIVNEINCFEGSLRVAVMLAIHMGFKKCTLVGCDYTHTPSRSMHWYENGEGVFIDQYKYNEDFFKIAQKYIKINTITLDGYSDTLESIKYKDYTGEEPKYRNNLELSRLEFLNILASVKKYKVFE